MSEIFSSILLRNDIVPFLETIHHRLLPDALFSENGINKPLQRFHELIKESLHWQKNAQKWCLYGARKRSDLSNDLTNRDLMGNSFLDSCTNVEMLYESYSWSIIPWGVDGTGMMIAFISSDENAFKEALLWLSAGGANQNVIVSRYTLDQLKLKRFRGAIFSRSPHLRGQLIWKCNPLHSALILFSQDENTDSILGSSTDIICRSRQGRVVRSWIQVHDESAFLRYGTSENASVILASDADETMIRESSGHFSDIIFEYINNDPLRFASKALGYSSWNYMPFTGDGNWEIYINNDHRMTDTLLFSDEMLREPSLLHRCFC